MTLKARKSEHQILHHHPHPSTFQILVTLTCSQGSGVVHNLKVSDYKVFPNKTLSLS